MKICPKCKNEYRDSITHCADCGCELIGASEEMGQEKTLAEAEYPFAKKLLAYLEYCKFTSVSISESDEEGMAKVSCDTKEYKEALKQTQVFVQEEMQRKLEEQLADRDITEQEAAEEEAINQTPPSNVYQNYKEKAEEHRSSAYSFLVIGGIGLAIVVLSWFDLLPFSIGGSGNWFTHGILFVFFLIFIYIGVVSAKSVGKYQSLASKEAFDKSELEKYLSESFTKEALEAITADTEEEAYFKRMTYMRDQVAGRFPDTAEKGSFVEALLDAHYDRIFG